MGGCATGGGDQFKALKKSAKQGDVRGQYFLGLMYEEGRNVPKDYAKTIEWYQKAANRGFGPAQFKLGKIYGEGRGVAKDIEKACYWYEKAGAPCCGSEAARQELKKLKKKKESQ